MSLKIKSLIQQGEGLQIEFKKCEYSLGRDVFETVCAFLNRLGGELFLGVNDNGKIIGIEKNRIYAENSNKPHGHGLIDPANFSPFPKNPVIAKFFKEIGCADELGSGVRNLFKYCKIYSNKDPQLIEEDVFKTIVPLCQKIEMKISGVKSGVMGGVKGGLKLSDRQKEIIVNMENNPTITYNELAKKLKINPSAVQKHIKKLKEEKVIKRIGKRRKGYWKLLRNSALTPQTP